MLAPLDWLIVLGIAVVVVALYETVRVLWYLRRAIAAGKRTAPLSQSGRGARVLIAGDSTAVGTGASHARYSIAGRLVSEVPELHIDNIGVNGMPSKLLCRTLRLHAENNGASYDAVFLHIGGIDTLSLVHHRSFAQNLAEAIATARTFGGHVVVVSPGNLGAAPIMRFPLLHRLYNWHGRRLRDAAESIATASGVTYINLFTPRETDPLRPQSGLCYAPDCIHPDDTGYGIWYNKIKEVCTARGIPPFNIP